MQRRRFYQGLYNQLPELKGNLSLLQTAGDYADVASGLYLYQDHLVCLGSKPALIDGARLQALTLYTVVTKGARGARVTRYALKAKVTAGPAEHFVAFGRQKQLVPAYQAYQEAVVARYPDVVINAEEETMG